MSHFHGSQEQCHGKGVMNSEFWWCQSSTSLFVMAPTEAALRKPGSPSGGQSPVCCLVTESSYALVPEVLDSMPRLDVVPYIEAVQTRRGKRAFTLTGLFPYQAVGYCAAPKQALVPPFDFATWCLWSPKLFNVLTLWLSNSSFVV